MRSSRVAGDFQSRGATFGKDITNIVTSTNHAKEVAPIKQQVPVPVAPKPEAVVNNIADCEEYVSDISAKLFQDEVAFMAHAHYMEAQADLTPKMRGILLDWLNEVHMKYKLRLETLHLTVNLIDRYLTKAQVSRKKLQLVGVAAMFIASKFEEIHPPELHDWVYITDKAYTKQDVLDMEVSMLIALNFQIMAPTAAHFFPLLEKANACSSTHSELVQYIMELGLLDIRILQYTPSHLVSAALLLSNELLGHRSAWPHSMVTHSHLTENSLRPCVELLKELFDIDRAGGQGQLRAVYKKFSQKEHQSVALMKL